MWQIPDNIAESSHSKGACLHNHNLAAWIDDWPAIAHNKMMGRHDDGGGGGSFNIAQTGKVPKVYPYKPNPVLAPTYAKKPAWRGLKPRKCLKDIAATTGI
jgi:hypothetical protein